MINLKFKRILAKNFMSFKEFCFDFSSFEAKSVLIYGRNEDIKGDDSRTNGSGKSTLENALLFSIYGDSLNSLKNTKHVRNWNASPSDDVELTLEIESFGTEYTIVRTLKGKKCSAELHVFSRVSKEEEWTEITRSTISETQKMIETDIVPCGKEGFLRCVILTADQNYNFFKLNKASKNSFFESLFELTTYSEMYNRLHRKTLDETSAILGDSTTIDNLNESIAKMEAERENAKRNQSDIINAKCEFECAKTEYEEFVKNNNLQKIFSELDYSLSAMKEEKNREFVERMKKFDSEHSIFKVESGNVIIDESKYDERINKELENFDKEHGITVDSNGNILFNESVEYSNLVEKCNTLRTRIENGEKAIENLENELRVLKNKVNDKESHTSSSRQSIENMQLTLKTHSRITELLCDECLLKYKKSVKIDDFDEKIKAFEKLIENDILEIRELKEKLGENEPTLKKYVNAVELLRTALTETKDKLSSIISERKTVQSERNLLKKQILSEKETERKMRQNERDSFKISLKNKLSDSIKKLSDEIALKKSSLTSAHDSLKMKFDSANFKYKTLSESKTKSFDAPIKSLKESLEKAKAQFDEKNENISYYKALEEVIKPDVIRKSVIPDMLKELNFRICGYLAKMGSNYTCEFDEDFEATFISSTGQEAEYNNFSSGEKMRLSIACCFAFRDFMQVRLNLHPNILIIDEYIDSNLDPMAVHGIMDMINFMVGTEKIGAFIISHRSEIMQSSFDSEIFVRKKNNESRFFIDGQQETD